MVYKWQALRQWVENQPSLEKMKKTSSSTAAQDHDCEDGCHDLPSLTFSSDEDDPNDNLVDAFLSDNLVFDLPTFDDISTGDEDADDIWNEILTLLSGNKQLGI